MLISLNHTAYNRANSLGQKHRCALLFCAGDLRHYMCMKMKFYAFISICFVFVSFSVKAGEYQTNPDVFWKRWEKSKQSMASCKHPRNTSAFIASALSYSGNAEVTEANAEVIEEMAINNPSCLVEGLAQFNDEQLKRFYMIFVRHALYHGSDEINASIRENGGLHRFKNVQKIFK